MAKILKYHIGSDEHLLLNAATVTLSGSLVTSATVTFTVALSGSTTGIAGQGWPSSMTVVNTEFGNWAGPLVNSLVVTDGQYYQARTTLALGNGNLAFFLIPIQGIQRDE